MSRTGRNRQVPVTLAGQMAAIVNGQKSKPIDRYPCGKLRPARQRERNAITPAMIQRIVLLAQQRAADPLLATPIGILRLQGELTDTQTAAATEYARLRGRADRALGLKARSAKSPSYETGYSGGVGAMADLDTFEKANDRFAELRERLRKLVVTAGGYRAGITMVDLVDRICVSGEPVESTYYDALKAGLTECAIFFGMVKKRV